jgi:hypothetical protein
MTLIVRFYDVMHTIVHVILYSIIAFEYDYVFFLISSNFTFHKISNIIFYEIYYFNYFFICLIIFSVYIFKQRLYERMKTYMGTFYIKTFIHVCK